MRISHRHAPEQRLDGVVDVTLLDPEKFEPVLVDGQSQPRSLLADRIVDIDDERYFGEDLLHFGSDGPARCRVRPVDFSEKSGEHGRPRRHLDDLDAGAGRRVDRLQALAQIQCDVVARSLAVGARGKVDLQFAKFGPLPQVIVANETVEIERRRRAGIGLHRSNFGQIPRNHARGKQRPLGVL